MTTILPSERSGFDVIGQQLGQNFQQYLGPALQRQNERQMNMDALDRAQQEIAQANGDPYKIAMIMARVGANNQNLQRAIGPLAETAIKYGQIERQRNAPSPSEIGGPRQHEAPPSFQPGSPLGENAPTNKFFPTNQPLGGATGNAPAAATTNETEKLRKSSEIDRDTKILNAKRREQGIIEPLAETRKSILEDEEQKVKYNAQVANEKEERRNSNRDYGKIGVDKLLEVHPEASPEQKAIFKRKAEDAASQGQSEGDIERYLANEAKNFAETIDLVQKSVSAPRFFEEQQRKFLGNQKDFESAASDIRVKLKPLLDLGLYDTARNLVTKLGYYPEEREMIINPFSEKEITYLNKVPVAKNVNRPENSNLAPQQGYSLQMPKEYSQSQRDDVKSGLMDLKSANPNFSLVLARKAFEDKNYDWRVFKDVLNEMVNNKEMTLESDQRTQLNTLDTPPLNILEKVLHGLNLRGR